MYTIRVFILVYFKKYFTRDFAWIVILRGSRDTEVRRKRKSQLAVDLWYVYEVRNCGRGKK